MKREESRIHGRSVISACSALYVDGPGTQESHYFGSYRRARSHNPVTIRETGPTPRRRPRELFSQAIRAGAGIPSVKLGSIVSLTWGSVAAGILLVILAASVVILTGDIKEDSISIQLDAVPGLVQANIIRSTYSEEYAWILHAVDEGSTIPQDEAQQQIAAFDKAARTAAEAYRTTMRIDPTADAALLQTMFAARQEYERTRAELLAAIYTAGADETRDQFLNQLSAQFHAVAQAADALVAYNTTTGRVYASHVSSTASTLRWSALGMILVLGFALFLHAKSVGRSIANEREIHQEQAKLAAAFRLSPFNLAISRRSDGRIVAVNDAFRRYYGIGDEVLPGRTAVEMGVWESTEERTQVLSEIERTGRLTNHLKRSRAADGTMRTLLVSAEPIVLDGEKCLLAVGQDITEVVNAQEALTRSEAELRVVFVNAAVGIALINSEGRAIRVNPALERILGYSADELTSLQFTALAHPENRQRDADLLAKLVSGERDVDHVQSRYIHKTGETVWANLTVSVQRDGADHQPLVIEMIEDITERKRAEEALHRSEVQRNELQQQLNVAQKLEALGQLAGGVAHDFNNMIAAIMLHLDVMRMESQVSPGIRDAVDELMKTARRAAGLTRQLLLFSRREPTHRQVVDLRGVVTNLLAMLERLIGSNFSLVSNFPTNPLWVHADPGMLEQVAMNLVVNARDAMPRGGRILLEAASVNVDAEMAASNSIARVGPHVRLTVTDTGIGMNAAVMQRIFEPFFTTKEQGKGTGLGLSTVFGIVQQHGGWIEVKSVEGHGASFAVFFPAHAAPTAVREQAIARIPPAFTPATILIADDNEQLRIITARILRAAGYSVIEASDGLTARKAYEDAAGSIDLVISDVVMPGGVLGDEIAHDILKRGGTKFILMSSSVENFDLAAFEAAGGTYLGKPFDTAQILAVVRSTLDPAAQPG